MANIAGTSIKLLPKSWWSLSVNAPQFRSSLHRSFSQHPAQHTATHSFALPSLDHWEAPAETDESLHGYGQTHTVFNQSTPLEGYNVFLTDSVLMDSVCREGAMWAFRYLEEMGELAANSHMLHLAEQANSHTPTLQTHDRWGNPSNQVTYHPAYHEMLRSAVRNDVHSFAHHHMVRGAHVARAAMAFMHSQLDAGAQCPLTMTFAGIPLLRAHHDTFEWVPKLLSSQYDSRDLPHWEKNGCSIGICTAEKQSGSDLRTATTVAVPSRSGGHLLTGHKWFCAAPMSDAQLTLAQTAHGLSCFLVPRWLPDGNPNTGFRFTRLKQKLGGHCNAWAELELNNGWGQMVGEPGEGLEMIAQAMHHTRLDATISAAATMRQSLAQALHHCSKRSAFGKLLNKQPLMQNVLTQLAVESEAATTTAMWLAARFDDMALNPHHRPLCRLATAVSKFWLCKLATPFVAESMECLGGNAYVEDCVMPRLFRQSPLSSIADGSGNVLCLEVLQMLQSDPHSADQFVQLLRNAKGLDHRLDQYVNRLQADLQPQQLLEHDMRSVVERMAKALQASLLVQHGCPAVAEVFCAWRLSNEGNSTSYGCLPSDTPFWQIIDRNTVKC